MGQQSGGQVIKKITTPRASFIAASRTQKCSPTTCPKGVASASAQNSEELKHMLTQHFETGGGLLFGTLTLKSDFISSPRGFSNSAIAVRSLPEYQEIKNMPLASNQERRHLIAQLQEKYTHEVEANTWEDWTLSTQLKAVREALMRTFVGNVWVREASKLGVLGRVSSLEVTLYPHPKLGWKKIRANLHAHFLLFTEEVIPDADPRVTALKDSLHGRWSRVLAKHGFTSRLKHQQLVSVVPSENAATRLSSYLPKGSLSEKTNDGSERTQGRSLFAPLIDAAKAHAQGLPVPVGAVSLWKNLEALFSGIHLYRVTPSLLQRYRVKEFRASKKASRRAVSVEPLAVVDPKEWLEVKKTTPELMFLLQEAATSSSPAVHLSELFSSLNVQHLPLNTC